MGFAGGSGPGLRFVRRSLSPETFSAVKKYGQQLGCTVNDMLLAAAFRSCVRAFDPPTGVAHSMMCTADLRRYLPSPESLPISNISISGSLDIVRIPDESFDKTLVRVRERMSAWAETCYGAAPVGQTEKMLALGYRVNKALMGAVLKAASKSDKTYPFFTNFGIIDETQLGFAGLSPARAYMYGPAAIGPGVVFVASTYQNELTVSMGFNAEDADAAVLESVLASMVEELETQTSNRQ